MTLEEKFTAYLDHALANEFLSTEQIAAGLARIINEETTHYKGVYVEDTRDWPGDGPHPDHWGETRYFNGPDYTCQDPTHRTCGCGKGAQR